MFYGMEELESTIKGYNELAAKINVFYDSQIFPILTVCTGEDTTDFPYELRIKKPEYVHGYMPYFKGTCDGEEMLIVAKALLRMVDTIYYG